ncbi:MAG: DedA family protein [Treponema sp.]
MITGFISQYISYFPLVIFISLLLGGFNLPIPEDILVISSAVICKHDKAAIPAFYTALYFGALLSDCLVYLWGVLLKRGSRSALFFTRIITEERTNRISDALVKHSFLTYVFGRFIPFGVRNLISMTSGFVGFPFYKFFLFDAFAALCNISCLFWFVYFLGAKGGQIMKIVGIILFIVFIAVLIYILFIGHKNIAVQHTTPNQGEKQAN